METAFEDLRKESNKMPSQESKQNFALMRDKILSENGKEYWRSIEEFVDAPEFEEFVKREYPLHSEDWNSAFSRRNFRKADGRDARARRTFGLRYPAAREDRPVRCAPKKTCFPASRSSSRRRCRSAASRRASCKVVRRPSGQNRRKSRASGQPRRDGCPCAGVAAGHVRSGPVAGDHLPRKPRTWQNFMTTLRAAIEENRVDGGAGIRFLDAKPLLRRRCRIRFDGSSGRAAECSKWYQYEPVNNDNAMAGARMAFGSPANTVYKFDLAERILTLDKDIFSDFNVRVHEGLMRKRQHFSEEKQGDQSPLRRRNDDDAYGCEGRPPARGQAEPDARDREGDRGRARRFAVPASTYTENAAMDRGDGEGSARRISGRSIVIAGDNQPPVVHAWPTR